MSHVALENYFPCKLKHSPAAPRAVLLGARRGAKITPRRRISRIPTTLHIRVGVRQIGMIENVLRLGTELEFQPLPNPEFLEDRCIHIFKAGAVERVSVSRTEGKLRRIFKCRTIDAGATRIAYVELGGAMGRRQ